MPFGTLCPGRVWPGAGAGPSGAGGRGSQPGRGLAGQSVPNGNLPADGTQYSNQWSIRAQNHPGWHPPGVWGLGGAVAIVASWGPPKRISWVASWGRLLGPLGASWVASWGPPEPSWVASWVAFLGRLRGGLVGLLGPLGASWSGEALGGSCGESWVASWVAS